MTYQQIKALRDVGAAIIEACECAGHTGAPGGVIYAALMRHGCTMAQFQSLMRGLCKTGHLRQDGDCYFATGKELLTWSDKPAAPVAGPVGCVPVASERGLA